MGDFEAFDLERKKLDELATAKVVAKKAVVSSELSEDDSLSEIDLVYDEKVSPKEDSWCKHANTQVDGGLITCLECGLEVENEIVYEKDWKYYGADYGPDPTRCQPRRSTEKSIYKDVENMGFSDRIVEISDRIFGVALGDRITRKKARTAVIYGCIHFAYKIEGHPQGDSLVARFHIDNKKALKGLKYVKLHVPKDMLENPVYVSPTNIIEELMDKLNSTPDQKSDVIKIYEFVKNKSSVLNRSRPQSVAASIIYVYTVLAKKDIDIEDFTHRVSLSFPTIQKLSDEIFTILDISTRT
jgi:hypothetical protein